MSRYLIRQEMRYRLQVVSLREGIPGPYSHQPITLASQKLGVSTQGHRITGHNDDPPGSNGTQGLDHGLSGPCSRRIENHSIDTRALVARRADPPADVVLLHRDNVASIGGLQHPSSLICRDR